VYLFEVTSSRRQLWDLVGNLVMPGTPCGSPPLKEADRLVSRAEIR
jgi:hypothetical protein